MGYKKCLYNTISNVQSDTLSLRVTMPFGTPERAGVPTILLPLLWSHAKGILPTRSFIPQGMERTGRSLHIGNMGLGLV